MFIKENLKKWNILKSALQQKNEKEMCMHITACAEIHVWLNMCKMCIIKNVLKNKSFLRNGNMPGDYPGQS